MVPAMCAHSREWWWDVGGKYLKQIRSDDLRLLVAHHNRCSVCGGYGIGRDRTTTHFFPHNSHPRQTGKPHNKIKTAHKAVSCALIV